jgi:hypothetical protein
MSLKQLVFLTKPLYLIGTWFSEDQRANIIKKHMSISSNIMKYSTLNNEHNWGD